MKLRQPVLRGGFSLLMILILASATQAWAEPRKGERQPERERLERPRESRDERLDDERRERLRNLRDEMRREHQARQIREPGWRPSDDEREEMRRAWREDRERRESRQQSEARPRPAEVKPPPSAPARDARDAPAGPRPEMQRLSPEERRALRRELRDAYRDR